MFLYFRFAHRYFNQAHGRTTTPKISNALLHSVGMGSLLQPSLCAESRLWAQPFVLQYRPVVTKGDQKALVACSSALLSCSRAEKVKDFLHLRQTCRWTFGDEGVYYMSEWNWKEVRPRKTRMTCHLVIDGIQAFILERPQQVKNDGMDWIYTAAVRWLYKEATCWWCPLILLLCSAYTRGVPWVYHNMLIIS